MTDHIDTLIAQYLAGEDVGALLIAEMNANPQLAERLAKDVAFSRLVRFALEAKSDDEFMHDFADALSTQQLQESAKTLSFWDNLAAYFNPSNMGWQHASAMAAACLLVWLSIIRVTDVPVGNVTQSVDAVVSNQLISEDYEVTTGAFSLQSGYANMTLSNGVTLLLEAPTSLRIISADHVVVESGSVVANVPQQAIGFKVDTPSAEIVDLGTEFAVSVQSNGESEVHVLTGEIKVRATKRDEFEHLVENQARAFDLSQQVAIIESQPQRFMRSLPGKSAADPDYLHWSFDAIKNGVFPCSGKGITGKCFDAKPMSLNSQTSHDGITVGEFGQAVDFNGQDNWLETRFSGIGGNDPRTVAFWVKVPKPFDSKNAYGILSWGLSAKLSAWQISPNPSHEIGPLGAIRIGTNHAEIIGTTDLADNQWHHIAIVLFGGEEVNLSTHVLVYVDGKLEKTTRKSIARVYTELSHPKSRPLKMGKNIAFDNLKNKKQQNRFFKGGLDELYIFNTALTQAQIKRLMLSNEWVSQQ